MQSIIGKLRIYRQKSQWNNLFVTNLCILILLSIVTLNKCAIPVSCSSLGGDLGHEIETNGYSSYAIHRFLADVQGEQQQQQPFGSGSRRDSHNYIEIVPPSSPSSPSRSNPIYSSAPVDINNDGLCSIVMRTRRSLSPTNILLAADEHEKSAELIETTLICSQIDELNYREMVTSIYRRSEQLIHQIHIVSSEPSVVISAIDLICDKFDCSKLTVFNVTGQAIHECNKLANWLASWTQLEVLDLSNTSLRLIQSILPVDAQLQAKTLKNLTHLHLDGNKLDELDFNFISERMPNLKHLSLVNNTIYSIYCNESLRSRLRSQLETISLAGNAINCDKSQLWFMKLIQDPITNLKFPEHDHIKCSAPEHLIDMTWTQRISVHETKICDDCICRSLKRTAISVDCHNKNLTALPDVLPINTKILNLTSNRITSLSVPQNSKNWENVTYVHLENNLISSFQQLEVNSKFMRNLAALDIRRNRFQEFPSHILEQFINLDQVHLSNNPWLCDCESAFAFQEWLQRQFHKVGDKEEIRCGVPGNEENGLRSISLKQRLSSRVIYKLSKSELCPQDNLEEPYDWLDIINLTLGITIILIITKVIMDYIYQRRTKRLPHFFRLNI
uniref:Protein halfway n=1 Tax=Aceria tosichella TaxID=561515 RepID=A0A6G1SAE3_9ACAR